MIDGVTLGIHGDDAAIVRRQAALDWSLDFDEDTAELSIQAIGKFGCMDIEYMGPRFVRITGSMHHLWNHLRGNGKVNWDQFGYPELCWTIDQLAQAIGLPASCIQIHGIEIGINLENPPFDVSGAIQAIILHKNKPFARWERGIGRVAYYGQYEIKVYHKGKQSHVGKKWQGVRQILRVELKIRKMQNIEGLGVETVEDLKDPERLTALFERLGSHLRRVTIIEPSVRVSVIPKPSEKAFWAKATYLDYWQQLPSNRIRYQKGKVERIILEAGTQSLKTIFLSEVWKAFGERMKFAGFYTLDDG